MKVLFIHTCLNSLISPEIFGAYNYMQLYPTQQRTKLENYRFSEDKGRKRSFIASHKVSERQHILALLFLEARKEDRVNFKIYHPPENDS